MIEIGDLLQFSRAKKAVHFHYGMSAPDRLFICTRKYNIFRFGEYETYFDIYDCISNYAVAYHSENIHSSFEVINHGK